MKCRLGLNVECKEIRVMICDKKECQENLVKYGTHYKPLYLIYGKVAE